MVMEWPILETNFSAGKWAQQQLPNQVKAQIDQRHLILFQHLCNIRNFQKYLCPAAALQDKAEVFCDLSCWKLNGPVG